MPQIGGGLTDQPIRLVARGDGPCLIVNRDLINQIMIGPDTGIAQGNPNEISIVDPLGSVSVDGKSDIWGVRVPGASTRPSVDVMKGATYWAPSPAQVAAQINALGLAKETTQLTGNGLVGSVITTLGTPSQDATTSLVASHLVDGSQLAGIIANPVQLYNISSQTITQGSVQQLVPVAGVKSAVAGYAMNNELGYEMNIQLANAAAGTNSFVRVDISYFDTDSLTASPIDINTWFLPVAANGSGPVIITAKGPLRGVYNSVVVTVPSPGFANAGSVVLSMQMYGTARQYSRDIWFEQSPYAGLGGSNPVRPGGVAGYGSNALWSIGTQGSPTTLTAGSSLQRLLPLMSGKQFIRMGANLASGGNVMGFHFYPQNSLANAGGGSGNPLAEFFLGSTTGLTTQEVWFPNDPVNLFIQNNAAVSGSVFCLAVNEQY